MGAQPAMPSKSSPLAKEAQKIKDRIDQLLEKMERKPKYMPSRGDLDHIAQLIIDFINEKHDKVAPYETHLKAAIIDLTEVPEMAPQMQRISYATTLKDASQKMDLFLSCCS